MSITTLYRHGLSIGKAGMNKNPKKRGICSGWSAAVARRHTHWLQSVDETQLNGRAFSFTLTVAQTPETPEIWSKCINHFLVTMMRGAIQMPPAIRVNWVTEWQKRKVPHLHGTVFFPEDVEIKDSELINYIKYVWFKVLSNKGLNSVPQAQDSKPLHDAVGWLQYMAKHGARGVAHYQRVKDAVPPKWRGKTGRMWGKVGNWPVEEPIKLEIDNQKSYWRFRRLLRSATISASRKKMIERSLFLQKEFPSDIAKERAERAYAASVRSLSYARRILKDSKRKRGSVKGLGLWLSKNLLKQLCVVIKAYPSYEDMFQSRAKTFQVQININDSALSLM